MCRTGEAPAGFRRGLGALPGLRVLAVSGGVPDGGGDEREVALVEAGDGIAEADRGPGGEARGDAEDGSLAAAGRELPVVEGAGGGLPVDPGRERAAAGARGGPGEPAGEVGA